MVSIKVIDSVQNPLTLMGECASVCWNSSPSAEIGKSCLKAGHGRVSEYPDVILAIEGYSARVVREIYTHIVGVTRLQMSTRYVDYDNFDYYIPPSVLKSDRAIELYEEIMFKISETYGGLIDLEIPKEDVANILPFGMESTFVLKINARALINMSAQRLCTRAYQECRDLMKHILEVVAEISDEWKWIVDNFCTIKCIRSGFCSEEHCCGIRPKLTTSIKSDI